MTVSDFIALLTATGWCAVVMFVAVLAGAAGGLPLRAAGWLIACGLLRAIAAVIEVPSDTWSVALAVVTAGAFWESARELRNASGAGSRVSAAWLLVPAELVALRVAVRLGTETAAPDWFWPIAGMLGAAPGALAVIALPWWWRVRAAPRVWRWAGAGLALACALPADAKWAGVELSCAWLVAASLGVMTVAQPSTRTRGALACLGGFVLTPLLAPVAINLAAERAYAEARAELVARANQTAAELRQRGLAALGRTDEAAVAFGRRLFRAADDRRAADAALRSVVLWRLTGTSFERLDESGRFVPWRPSTPAERTAEARGQTYVSDLETPSASSVIAAHAPLRVSRFESPVAWVALEYPAVLVSARGAAAARIATGTIALLAAICAGVFVLVARQGREAAQRAELERAQAADRAKTEFLAFLGHELRTPLQVILGRAELLARDDSAAARERAREAIATHGRLMLRLVNDLLDLGTLEAGKLVLHPQPLALRALLRQAHESAAAAAAGAGLGCTLHIDEQLPVQVVADEARLLQVLGNLLGNAVKYTCAGGVELHAERGATRPDGRMVLRLRVRDTGIGLPPEKIAQLFTLFTRLDTGATFTREGTGVGLALVKRLLNLMDGTVTAANRADGAGAEFTVELPVVVSVTPTPAASEASVRDPRRLRVLVAEDHPAVGELLADNLRALGHEPVVMRDGVAARSRAREGGFDAVLIDVNLPGIDGIALASELARLNPRPRLIGCSAEVLPETRGFALRAGMDEFLAKPVASHDLERALAPVATGGANFFAALQTAAGGRVRELALATLPQTRAAITAARARGDRAELARQAHFLRNTAQVLSDAALAAEADAVGRES